MDFSHPIIDSIPSISTLPITRVNPLLEIVQTAVLAISGRSSEVVKAFDRQREHVEFVQTLVQYLESSDDQQPCFSLYLRRVKFFTKKCQVVSRAMGEGRIDEIRSENVRKLTLAAEEILAALKTCVVHSRQLDSEWEIRVTYLPPPRSRPVTPFRPRQTSVSTPSPYFRMICTGMNALVHHQPQIFGRAGAGIQTFVNQEVQAMNYSDFGDDPMAQFYGVEFRDRSHQSQQAYAQRQSHARDEEFAREMHQLNHPDGHAAALSISAELKRYSNSLEEQVAAWEEFISQCHRGEFRAGPEDAAEMKKIVEAVNSVEFEVGRAVNVLKAASKVRDEGW